MPRVERDLRDGATVKADPRVVRPIRVTSVRTVPLVVLALLASSILVAAPSEALVGTPVRYVVAFTQLPAGAAVGGTWLGGTIYHVDPVLKFLGVESTSADFKPNAHAEPAVRYVELDLAYGAHLSPNDPEHASQYAPTQVRLPLAWDATTGDVDAKVCVVDSGARATHLDLAGARYLGGWDFVGNDADPADDNGHGTHVLGIAAAGVGNAVGVAGAGNVGYLVAKVLPASGPASWSDIASAIRWCADAGGPRTVISMSLGGGTYSQVVDEATLYAYNEKGSLLVASTGNGGCEDCVQYPAKLEQVIGVACTTAAEAACAFQSSGDEAELTAPGENVLSTCHAGDEAYCLLSGTSMSTPLVSGVAALYWSQDTTITNVDLRTRLRQTAQDLQPAGRDERSGFGEVDAHCLFTGETGCNAPSNNLFATAQSIARTPFARDQGTQGATTEAAEPSACPDTGATVWYKWTAPASATATVSTSGSGFDTVVAVYKGSSLSALETVDCNDDDAGTPQSRVTFTTLAGVTYAFQVGGRGGATGPLKVQVECPACLGPDNDDFSLAQAVTLVPSAKRQATTAATTQAGEPLNCGGGMTRTVWFRWVPQASGTATIDTHGSTYDTILAVYTGSAVSNLVRVGCNDQASGTDQSELTLAVTAGTTYHVQVGGFSGQTGALQLHVQCASCTSGPANDARERAGVVNWIPYSTTQATTSATLEPGEETPCGTLASTVWFRLTAAVDASLAAHTFDSNYDTVLAAYEENGGSLSLLRCNDDHNRKKTSHANFNVQAGKTYWFQVGGSNGATGELRFRVECTPSCVVTHPGNDDVANAYPITSPPPTWTNLQSTSGYTLQPGEPAPLCAGTVGATAWYSLSPVVPKAYALDTGGSGYDTVLAVYLRLGDTWIPWACSNDFLGMGSASKVVYVGIPAPGVSYMVQVGGVNGASGLARVTAA